MTGSGCLLAISRGLSVAICLRNAWRNEVKPEVALVSEAGVGSGGRRRSSGRIGEAEVAPPQAGATPSLSTLTNWDKGVTPLFR